MQGSFVKLGGTHTIAIVREVDFHKLTRSVQDRFIGSTRGTDPPGAILKIPGGPRGHLIWVVICAACVAGLLALAVKGFGELDSAMAVQSVGLAVVYAALSAVASLGVFAPLAAWTRTRLLPYPPGIYLFPSGVVDARRNILLVYPLTEALSIEGPTRTETTIHVVFPKGVRFSFPTPGLETAEQASNALADAKVQAAELEATPDPKRLINFDPLYEPRFSSPLAPKEPFVHRVPGWVKAHLVIGLLVGLPIGPLLFTARNASSDDKMFAVASQRNDVAAYQAYLVHGARHRTEVEKTLLPRAELELAKKEGSVEAILAYKAKHPSSAIEKEIADALRTAMLAELEKAKKPGTLAALADFAKKYPDHGLDPELKAARHAVYVAALERYKSQASKDPAVAAFADRLIAWAEKSGGTVQVRFRRKASQTLGRADKSTAKHPDFNGEASYPSKYFDAAHVSPHEQALAKAIAERLGQAFPAEILTFAVGPTIDDAPDALPAVTAPTLFVTWGVEWNGGAYASKIPRGIYVTLTYSYESAFVLPNDDKPLKLKFGTTRGIPVVILKDLRAAVPGSGTAETKVYDTMTKEAFDLFAVKLMSTFFKS